MHLSSGVKACFSSGGISGVIFPANTAVVHFGSRAPMDLTIPRTTFTSLTRGSHQRLTTSHHRQIRLRFSPPMPYRRQQLHIHSAQACQHASIQPVVFAIAFVNQPNLASIRNHDLMPVAFEPPRDPRRVCSHFNHDSSRWPFSELLFE